MIEYKGKFHLKIVVLSIITVLATPTFAVGLVNPVVSDDRFNTAAGSNVLLVNQGHATLHWGQAH